MTLADITMTPVTQPEILELFLTRMCPLTHRTAFFYVRNRSKIRNMLSQSDIEKLVNAFITSVLEHSLLSGCSKSSKAAVTGPKRPSSSHTGSFSLAPCQNPSSHIEILNNHVLKTP